ncbi:unnamed protein product [Acanthoscelides obtectus]|nr:unnamed protein product [Acanthoscelides obtectus]CAK1644985.1 Forkhead box protein N4 [Acanthoscelides obtectus]
MSAAMDMFLTASDSLSYPDILDIDIKSEIDTLVGGHNDFSGFNFTEMPSLEFEDVHDIRWFNSSSNHSTLDFSGGDGDGPTMVNPNAVMPVVSLANNARSPSPSFRESHLTFSPATIKIPGAKAVVEATAQQAVKKDLVRNLQDVGTIAADRNKNKTVQLQTQVKLAKVTPILARPVSTSLTTELKTIKTIQTAKGTQHPTILTFRNTVSRPLTSSTMTMARAHAQAASLIRTVTPVRKLVHAPAVPTLTSRTGSVFDSGTGDDLRLQMRTFPKPAYSYSCLIAMALKNSRSGSLPVSEIYNFMCRHFPYFKTAPNGWKNSVRHNLSLNKCFEKIEKPALNGAQRKGCLWAMNPAKISKMDDEVQKWSRKDPLAIRRAMVNPEHLEALERGEMKFSCSMDENDTFGGDSCGSAEERSSEEGSDSEREVEEEEIEVDHEEQYEYVQVKEEGSDVDIEVSDVMYTSDDIEDDKELLRVEMALAQKELLEYERTVNNKRRRTYLIQQ